jgi:hypothetical protein
MTDIKAERLPENFKFIRDCQFRKRKVRMLRNGAVGQGRKPETDRGGWKDNGNDMGTQ